MPVDGDATLAGDALRVRAPLVCNAYVAGGRLQLDREMGRNLLAASRQVELRRDARLVGNVTIAAGDTSVLEPVHGSLGNVGRRAIQTAGCENSWRRRGSRLPCRWVDGRRFLQVDLSNQRTVIRDRQQRLRVLRRAR